MLSNWYSCSMYCTTHTFKEGRVGRRGWLLHSKTVRLALSWDKSDPGVDLTCSIWTGTFSNLLLPLTAKPLPGLSYTSHVIDLKKQNPSPWALPFHRVWVSNEGNQTLRTLCYLNVATSTEQTCFLTSCFHEDVSKSIWESCNLFKRYNLYPGTWKSRKESMQYRISMG